MWGWEGEGEEVMCEREGEEKEVREGEGEEVMCEGGKERGEK